jgi:hypothetical protein
LEGDEAKSEARKAIARAQGDRAIRISIAWKMNNRSRLKVHAIAHHK